MPPAAALPLLLPLQLLGLLRLLLLLLRLLLLRRANRALSQDQGVLPYHYRDRLLH